MRPRGAKSRKDRRRRQGCVRQPNDSQPLRAAANITVLGPRAEAQGPQTTAARRQRAKPMARSRKQEARAGEGHKHERSVVEGRRRAVSEHASDRGPHAPIATQKIPERKTVDGRVRTGRFVKG